MRTVGGLRPVALSIAAAVVAALAGCSSSSGSRGRIRSWSRSIGVSTVRLRDSLASRATVSRQWIRMIPGTCQSCLPLPARGTNRRRKLRCGRSSRPCGRRPRGHGSLTPASVMRASRATGSRRKWSHGARRTTSRGKPTPTSCWRSVVFPHVRRDAFGCSSHRPTSAPCTARWSCSCSPRLEPAWTRWLPSPSWSTFD